MLFARTLSHQEEESLLKLSRSSDTIIHRRSRIVVLSAQGRAVKEIAERLGMHSNSIRAVINSFNECGIDCLYPKPRPGRPRKFDQGCCDKIVELVRHKPTDFSVESGAWTLSEAVEVIKGRQVVSSMCIESLRLVMKRAGLSWKRVKGWIAPSDPRYEERKKKIEETVTLVLNDPESDLEYTDESWFVAQEPSGVKNHQTGSSWSDVGKPETVPTSSSKGKKTLPIYAGLSVKDKQVRYMFTEKTDTNASIAYLSWRAKECRERGIRRLYIVWDNASFHLSKALREWLGEHNEKAGREDSAIIELVPMPNKSPWLNLIEVVFRWLKRRALFCRIHETLEILMQVIEACIQDRNRLCTPAQC
jgi:transposase